MKLFQPHSHIFQHSKIVSVFCFRDVQTSEIKLQLNNAAGGQLKRNKILFYFTRPHIPETEIKQNCGLAAETPRSSAVLFYFSFISPCATALRQLGMYGNLLCLSEYGKR